MKKLLLTTTALFIFTCNLFSQTSGFAVDVMIREEGEIVSSSPHNYGKNTMAFFSSSGEIKILSPSLFEEGAFGYKPRLISKNGEILAYSLNDEDIKVINLKNNTSFYLSDFQKKKLENVFLKDISDDGQFIIYTYQKSPSEKSPLKLMVFNTVEKDFIPIPIEDVFNYLRLASFVRGNNIIFCTDNSNIPDVEHPLYFFNLKTKKMKLISKDLSGFEGISNAGNQIFNRKGNTRKDGFINIYSQKITFFKNDAEKSLGYSWSDNGRFIAWSTWVNRYTKEKAKTEIIVIDTKTKTIYRKLSLDGHLICEGWYDHDNKLVFRMTANIYPKDIDLFSILSLNVVTGKLENITENERIGYLETMACPVLNIYENDEYRVFKEILIRNIKEKQEGLSLDVIPNDKIKDGVLKIRIAEILDERTCIDDIRIRCGDKIIYPENAPAELLKRDCKFLYLTKSEYIDLTFKIPKDYTGEVILETFGFYQPGYR